MTGISPTLAAALAKANSNNVDPAMPPNEENIEGSKTSKNVNNIAVVEVANAANLSVVSNSSLVTHEVIPNSPPVSNATTQANNSKSVLEIENESKVDVNSSIPPVAHNIAEGAAASAPLDKLNELLVSLFGSPVGDKYFSEFCCQAIDYDALLLLTAEELKEIGLPIGARVKVQAAINKLNNRSKTGQQEKSTAESLPIAAAQVEESQQIVESKIVKKVNDVASKVRKVISPKPSSLNSINSRSYAQPIQRVECKAPTKPILSLKPKISMPSSVSVINISPSKSPLSSPTHRVSSLSQNVSSPTQRVSGSIFDRLSRSSTASSSRRQLTRAQVEQELVAKKQAKLEADGYKAAQTLNNPNQRKSMSAITRTAVPATATSNPLIIRSAEKSSHSATPSRPVLKRPLRKSEGSIGFTGKFNTNSNTAQGSTTEATSPSVPQADKNYNKPWLVNSKLNKAPATVSHKASLSTKSSDITAFRASPSLELHVVETVESTIVKYSPNQPPISQVNINQTHTVQTLPNKHDKPQTTNSNSLNARRNSYITDTNPPAILANNPSMKDAAAVIHSPIAVLPDALTKYNSNNSTSTPAAAPAAAAAVVNNLTSSSLASAVSSPLGVSSVPRDHSTDLLSANLPTLLLSSSSSSAAGDALAKAKARIEQARLARENIKNKVESAAAVASMAKRRSSILEQQHANTSSANHSINNILAKRNSICEARAVSSHQSAADLAEERKLQAEIKSLEAIGKQPASNRIRPVSIVRSAENMGELPAGIPILGGKKKKFSSPSS
jgi:hypothetical protein